MPIYTYRCDYCGHQFDKEQNFSASPLRVCPECRKHALYKVYKPAGVVFKGSGFYVTDKRSAKSSTVGSSNGRHNGHKESKETTESKSSEKPSEKSKTVEAPKADK
jgi:putative FmdB family regulatory protein